MPYLTCTLHPSHCPSCKSHLFHGNIERVCVTPVLCTKRASDYEQNQRPRNPIQDQAS